MKRILFALAVCLAAWQLTAADLPWQTDLPKALVQAKAERKLVLVDFTGSDWCPACKQMEKEVFSQPEFAAYAQTNLVLLQVDLPYFKEQPEALKKANKALADKYSVDALPLFLTLKPDGTISWQTIGYIPGGPKAFIEQLQKGQKP